MFAPVQNGTHTSHCIVDHHRGRWVCCSCPACDGHPGRAELVRYAL